MNHVMVDLEILGLTPDSAILSIGAVRFDLNGQIGDTFHSFIALSSNKDYNRNIDINTIEWWMTQPEEVRRRVFNGEGRSLSGVLDRFADWYTDNPRGDVRYIWSHGSNFDLVLLEHAYRVSLGWDSPPWNYKDARDTRTLFWLAGYEYQSTATVKHDALEDAISQAKAVQAAYKLLVS